MALNAERISVFLVRCMLGLFLALMALGLKYGHFKLGDEETKSTLLEKRAEFEKEFKAINGSRICREILGYDLSTEEGMTKIMEKGLLTTK